MTTKEAPGNPTATPHGVEGGRENPAGVRASDTERERAVEALRKHYETGHIGYAEFNERMERAYQATHSHELTALLADLPGAYQDKPGVPAVAASPPVKQKMGAGKIVAITGLVIASFFGLTWLFGLITSHPVISLVLAGVIVWLVVKKPFRRST